MAQSTPTHPISGSGPVAILQEAIRAVPAVRYALGVAGIGAAVAIIGGFKTNFRVAAFGIIIMFFLMVVLVVFARLSAAPDTSFAYARQFLLWASLLLITCVAALLVTSIFFSWPRDWRIVIGIGQVSENTKGGPIATEPSKTSLMKQGKAFTLILNKLNARIGSIVPGASYIFDFSEARCTWTASGPHADDSGNVDFARSEWGYGPGSPGNLDKCYTPDQHVIIIWGHDFSFNESGDVSDGEPYDATKQVGEIVHGGN